MTRRAILHTGHSKTATTYLQHFLHLNEDLLARQGYHLPADFTGLGYPNYRDIVAAGRTFSGNAWPLFEALRRGEKLTPFETLLGSDGSLILSTEMLFYYVHSTRKIVAFLSSLGYQVQILAYVPLYDRGVVSSYVQNVRNHGLHAGVLEFLDSASMRYCMYGTILSELRGYLPQTRIDFRQFRREALLGGRIEDDFVAHAAPELEASTMRRPTHGLNPSLRLEILELLRVFNRIGYTPGMQAARKMEEELGQEARDTLFHFYFTETVAQAVRERFADDKALLLSQVDWPQSDHEAWSFERFTPSPASIDPHLLLRALDELMRLLAEE